MAAFKDCLLKNYYEQEYVKVRYTDFTRLERKVIINHNADQIPSLLTVPENPSDAWVFMPAYWARDSYAIWRLEQRRFLYTRTERLMGNVNSDSGDSDTGSDSDPGFKVKPSPKKKMGKTEPLSYDSSKDGSCV